MNRERLIFRLEQALTIRECGERSPLVAYCIECDEIRVDEEAHKICGESHTVIEEHWESAAISEWIRCLEWVERE